MSQTKFYPTIDKDSCTTEVFSRVTGFFRPVQEWNDGKQAEFKARNTYDIYPMLKDKYKDQAWLNLVP